MFSRFRRNKGPDPIPSPAESLPSYAESQAHALPPPVTVTVHENDDDYEYYSSEPDPNALGAPVAERTLSTNSARLHNRDYVVIIDKSQSMRFKLKKGKFKGKRRINAIQELAIDMARDAEHYDPDGLTIYVVSKKDNMEIHDNVTHDHVVDVFDDMKHESGSYLYPALQHIFDAYLIRRANGEGKDGMIICVFCDGEPHSKKRVASVIREFTHHLEREDEVGITFIKVNDKDSEADEFFTYLDDSLQHPGHGGTPPAKFDIVDAKSIEFFEERGSKTTFLEALDD